MQHGSGATLSKHAAGPRRSASLRDDPLPRALGWASAALGVPPLASPGGFARTLGVGDAPRHRAVAAVVGVRELMAAAGLLGKPHPIWLWTRVGGDAMDLTLMARALKNHDGKGLRRTAFATAAVTAITGIDLYAAVTRTQREEGSVMELTGTTTVLRPAEEVYAFWHDLARLPSFMAHLDEVRITAPGRSHWRVSAPFGRTVEWEAEMIEEVPGRSIAWASLEDAEVRNSGEVRFDPAPGNRGTEVHVTLRYDMPAGPLGAAIARFFGEEPHQQLDDDLRRLKQVLETGEVVRSDGAPGGKRARGEFPQHPARPLSRDELKEVQV